MYILVKTTKFIDSAAAKPMNSVVLTIYSKILVKCVKSLRDSPHFAQNHGISCEISARAHPRADSHSHDLVKELGPNLLELTRLRRVSPKG